MHYVNVNSFGDAFVNKTPVHGYEASTNLEGFLGGLLGNNRAFRQVDSIFDIFKLFSLLRKHELCWRYSTTQPSTVSNPPTDLNDACAGWNRTPTVSLTKTDDYDWTYRWQGSEEPSRWPWSAAGSRGSAAWVEALNGGAGRKAR